MRVWPEQDKGSVVRLDDTFFGELGLDLEGRATIDGEWA
jgi:hypothetical protein